MPLLRATARTEISPSIRKAKKAQSSIWAIRIDLVGQNKGDFEGRWAVSVTVVPDRVQNLSLPIGHTYFVVPSTFAFFFERHCAKA